MNTDILGNIFIHSDLKTQCVLLQTYKCIRNSLWKYDSHIIQITLKSNPLYETHYLYDLYYAKIIAVGGVLTVMTEPYEDHEGSYYSIVRNCISNYRHHFIVPVNGLLMRAYIYNIYRVVDIHLPNRRGDCRNSINYYN